MLKGIVGNGAIGQGKLHISNDHPSRKAYCVVLEMAQLLVSPSISRLFIVDPIRNPPLSKAAIYILMKNFNYTLKKK